MPNRIIKESICRSEEIDSLSWFEEVLFYRLIVLLQLMNLRKLVRRLEVLLILLQS